MYIAYVIIATKNFSGDNNVTAKPMAVVAKLNILIRSHLASLIDMSGSRKNLGGSQT